MIGADNKNINNSVTIVAGVLITHMVTMHIQQFYNTNTTVYYWQNLLLSFFMPWFFLKSGMFFREKLPKQLFYESLKKYIKPFVFYTILGEFVYIFFLKSFGLVYEPISIFKIFYRGSTNGNPVLWFLPVLFLVRNISNYLLSSLSQKWNILLLFLLLLTINIYSAVNNKYIPWLLGDILMGCFFYMAGALLKTLIYNKKLYYISLIVYLIMLCTWPSLVNFWPCKLVYGNFSVWIISSLAGIILINNIFYRLVRLNKTLRFFYFIGENSMYFYCLHWIIINLCLLLLGKTFMENTMDLILVIIVCFISCSIISLGIKKIDSH